MLTIEDVNERLESTGKAPGDSIRLMAEVEFKDHKITELSKPRDYARVFRCGREGTGMYGFRVVVWPFYISIHGDVGGLTLSRDKDMIEWCRSAIMSPGYFFGKSDPLSQVKREFCDVTFNRWLKNEIEIAEEGYWTEERLVEICEIAEGCSVRDIIRFLIEEMDDQDAWEYSKSFQDYHSNLYWSLEAIRKFLELYDEMKSTPPEQDTVVESDKCHEAGYKLAEKEAKAVGVCLVCGGPGACCNSCF